MRIAKGLPAAIFGVSAGHSGNLEWTKTRGTCTDAEATSAFVGPVGSSVRTCSSRQQSSSFHRGRNLRRTPRASEDVPVIMRVVTAVPELINNLPVSPDWVTTSPSSGARWTPEWRKPVENSKGSDIAVAQMVSLKSDAEDKLGISQAKREAATKMWKHYDLTQFSHLLTKEEEIELGKKVQQMLRWERERSFLEVRLGRPPTLDEWAEELTDWDSVQGLEREFEEMRDARDRMIACNLRLVLHIARKSFFSGGSGGLKAGLDDMIQDGTAGLVKAVERFDPDKGFRFSTYASWWVHQGIHTGLANAGRTIRLPMNMHAMVCRVTRIRSKLAGLLGRDPTASEIAIAARLPESKIQHYMQVNKVEPYSLDAKAWTKTSNEDVHSNYRVEDTLRCTQEQEPVAEADLTLLRSNVEAILGGLTEREAEVLRMRFGIGGRSPSTLEVIGRRLLLTRERVRQIESDALEKLRGAAPIDETGLSTERGRSGDIATATQGWEQQGLPPRLLLLEMVENAFQRGGGEGDGKGRGRESGTETGRGRRKRKKRVKKHVAVGEPESQIQGWPTLQAIKT